MNSSGSAGLYLHVPFCRSKCAYCAFYSIPHTSLIHDWLKAIRREMEYYEGVFPPFDTIYFGGGTPSVLEDGVIAALLEEAFRRFQFELSLEITLEANPDDLSWDRLSSLRSLGINRLSVGVQSFSDADLRILGRRHTADQTRRILRAARDADFNSLSVDLIMGVPGCAGPPLSHWKAILKEALSFEPEHLSCYLLTYEAGTSLHSLMQNHGLESLDEEDERALFLYTSRHLEANGYLHYEVSNFARSDANRSRHNSKYWHHAPYLGLGPAAHSFLAGARWWNVRSVKEYSAMLARHEPPLAGRETLTPEQIRLEKLSLGLRTSNGISRRLLTEGRQTDATLAALRQEGLISVANDRIYPTPEGYLVSDSLPLLFLER
ncbi:MAG: radical SAM family heme chaperone HemW [Syntrophobacteraceae bacterium]